MNDLLPGVRKVILLDAMYTVTIVKNATGEARAVNIPDEWDDDYLWTDGNFGCDCNRALFFGEESDRKCGISDYSVPFVTLEDGTVVEVDEDI